MTPKPGRCVGCGKPSHTAYCGRCLPTETPEERKGEGIAAYKHNGQMIGKPQGLPRR